LSLNTLEPKTVVISIVSLLVFIYFPIKAIHGTSTSAETPEPVRTTNTSAKSGAQTFFNYPARPIPKPGGS
jgi:hypothetical protein